jgi:hypothetical protein
MVMNTSEDVKAHFQKSLNLLLNLTNSIGDKYNYIQILFNRIIKSSNMIRNFSYVLKMSKEADTELKIEKFYSNNHLLSLSLIIMDKILSFGFFNQ